MKEYHYVYEITYTDNTRYIGSRSSKVPPEDDTDYIGSSKHTPDHLLKEKIILGSFLTRQLAYEFENFLQIKNDVVKSSEYHNRAIQTLTGFSVKGLTKETCEGIRIASEKLKKYRGSNRTPAQIAGSISAATKATGQKVPSRGRKGSESNRFRPWYLEQPDGTLLEFHNMSITDFLESGQDENVTRASVFYATTTYEHMTIPSGTMRGYKVGFLPKPTSNLHCVPSDEFDSWWYKAPDCKPVEVHFNKRLFCDLGIIPNLSYSVIKNGIKHSKPLNKGPFKDWSFGLITGKE